MAVMSRPAIKAENRLHQITRPTLTSPPKNNPVMGVYEVCHFWWRLCVLTLNCQSYRLSSDHSNNPAMSHTARHPTEERKTSRPMISSVAFLYVCVCVSVSLLPICMTSEIKTPTPWVINKSDCNDGTLGRRCSINLQPRPIPVSSISALPFAAPN